MKTIISFLTLSLLSIICLAQFELEANYILSSPRSNFKTVHNAIDGSGISLIGTYYRPDKANIQFGLGFVAYNHSNAIGASNYALQQSEGQRLPINVNNYSSTNSGIIYLSLGYQKLEQISSSWKIGGSFNIMGYGLVMPDKSYSLLQASPDNVYFLTEVSSSASTAFDFGCKPELIIQYQLAKNLNASVRSGWLISSSLFSDVEFEESITVGSQPAETRKNTVNLSALDVAIGIAYTFGSE